MIVMNPKSVPSLAAAFPIPITFLDYLTNTVTLMVALWSDHLLLPSHSMMILFASLPNRRCQGFLFRTTSSPFVPSNFITTPIHKESVSLGFNKNHIN